MGDATNVDDERWAAGRACFEEVYGGVVEFPPDAMESPLRKLMITNLFADVWGRRAMSIRDRRLLLIGAVAASATDTRIMEIQLRAALKRGELSRDELPEIPVFLAQYLGYPRAVPINNLVTALLREHAEQEPRPRDGDGKQ